jgi:hypothetical protein
VLRTVLPFTVGIRDGAGRRGRDEKRTRPVAMAVVVAIAGMMRPAMSFACSLSTSGIW